MTYRKIFALSCALAVSACSGKTTLTPTPSPERARASVTIAMHWPALAPKSSVRVPKWISPSTRSVLVQVNDDARYTTIANNPSTGGPVTGSLTVDAPPGNDLIAFVLYDQADGKGNVVGQATVTQQIMAGKVNTISAAVDGIVASVDLTPLPNQPWIAASVDGNGNKQFAMKGDVAGTFAATALDAGGNVIVPAASPINYDVTAVSTALAVTPVAGQPSQFSVRSSGSGAGHQVGIVAHASGGQNASAQTNYGVVISPLLYVGYGNGGSGAIAVLDTDGTRITLPGNFPGVATPLASAFDASDHRFFVLDGTAHAIVTLNSDGTAGALANIPAPLGVGLTYDPHNGALYLLNSDGTVATYSALDGSTTAPASAWSGLNGAVAIYAYAPGPDLQIIFAANAADNTIVFFDETGTPVHLGSMRRTSFDATLTPSALTGNPTGNLYVAGSNSGTPQASEIALTGAQVGSTNAGLDSPAAIAFDGARAVLYVANGTSGTIAAYDDILSNQLSTIAPPSGLSHPSTVTIVY